MLVTFQDENYEFDPERIDVNQARVIKRQMKLTPRQMWEGLAELDPDACVAAYWLMMKQNGKTVDVTKVNFDLVEFMEALNAADDSDDEDVEENPTGDAQKTTSE